MVYTVYLTMQFDFNNTENYTLEQIKLELLSPSTTYPLLQQSKGGKLERNICDFK